MKIDDDKDFYDKLVGNFNGSNHIIDDDNDADNEPTDEDDLERLIGSQCRDDDDFDNKNQNDDQENIDMKYFSNENIDRAKPTTKAKNRYSNMDDNEDEDDE